MHTLKLRFKEVNNVYHCFRHDAYYCNSLVASHILRIEICLLASLLDLKCWIELHSEPTGATLIQAGDYILSTDIQYATAFFVPMLNAASRTWRHTTSETELQFSSC